MNFQTLSLLEAVAFNKTMQAHGIRAYIDIRSQDSAISSIKIFPEAMIIYKIYVEPGQQFSRIFSLEDEVKSAIGNTRLNNGFSIDKLAIRFDNNPFPTLEVDTPNGYKIFSEKMAVKPYTALIGTTYSFSGRKWFEFDLTEHHQTLIAAMSGHGKSVLLSRIARGLSKSTLPLNLSFHVIDFKNDDLAFTNDLSHTVHYAYTEKDAQDVIDFLSTDKDSRKENGWSKRRLLLIDEAAELPKKLDAQIASIMKMGRSMGLNVIAATQHPTAKQIGEQVARSFTHRFIGRTESASAAMWASGMESSGAELLKKPGSFLYCFGGNATRLQVMR